MSLFQMVGIANIKSAKCFLRSCRAPISRDRLFCGAHWEQLTPRLRERIYTAKSRNDIAGWRAAARDAERALMAMPEPKPLTREQSPELEAKLNAMVLEKE